VRRRVELTDIPQSVVDKLVADGKSRSINDICSGIFAERYGIPYEPTGRKAFRAYNLPERRLVLKVPEEVWVALKQDAVPYSSIRQVAIDALTLHYGLDRDDA